MPDHPSQLWHEQAALDNGGNLRVVVAWDRVDLGAGCMVRERVDYTQRDPIFDWRPPNPTINQPYVSAATGRAPDIHVKPMALRPYRAGRWIASQQYEYSLDNINWNGFGPRYTIRREIVQELGAWAYKITKSCMFVEGNGRSFSRMYMVSLP